MVSASTDCPPEVLSGPLRPCFFRPLRPSPAAPTGRVSRNPWLLPTDPPPDWPRRPAINLLSARVRRPSTRPPATSKTPPIVGRASSRSRACEAVQAASPPLRASFRSDRPAPGARGSRAKDCRAGFEILGDRPMCKRTENRCRRSWWRRKARVSRCRPEHNEVQCPHRRERPRHQDGDRLGLEPGIPLGRDPGESASAPVPVAACQHPAQGFGILIGPMLGPWRRNVDRVPLQTIMALCGEFYTDWVRGLAEEPGPESLWQRVTKITAALSATTGTHFASLPKYAVAFFRMSRSSETRASSRFNRRISASFSASPDAACANLRFHA